MYIDRQEIVEEIRLRKLIRKAIVIAEAKRANSQQQLDEEQRLRKIVRNLIAEAEVGDTEDSPYDSTGLNVLNTLFDNILKTIETGYKELASSQDQRNSFASHMLKAVENTLAPLRAMDNTDQLSEDIDISLNQDRPEDMADIRVDKAEQEVEDFGIEGQDLTGRDKAYETFNKVETQIVEAYKTLHSQDDIKSFYDGLLMNLDLYFKKFEDEIQPSVSAPETAADVQPEPDVEDTDLADIADL